MTNPSSPTPQPPRDERHDELIAGAIAFAAIGTILYWGLNRLDRDVSVVAVDPPVLRSESVDEVEESPGFLGSAREGARSLLPFGGVPVDRDRVELDELEDDEQLSRENVVIRSIVTEPREFEEDNLGAAGVVPAPIAVPEETPDEVAGGDTAEEESTPAVEFSDVSSDYWAAPFIAGLSQVGAVSGFEDSSFQPDEPITRAQFATLLEESFELEAAANGVNYEDLTADYWASDAIAQVTNAGFMSGYPGQEFRPDQQVSKLEVLVSLASGLGLAGTNSPEQVLQLLQTYSDRAQIPDWAVAQVAAATEAGLVVNYPNEEMLNPSQPATRAEAAAIIYQALAEQGNVSEVSSPYIVRP